jgi:spore germination protein YaaH
MRTLKHLIFAVLFLSPLLVYSQTVNDIPIKEINVEYIQIVGTSKLLSTKVTIEIDFGQRNKLFNFNDTAVKDENGKLLELNSMIDALNFMNKNGYEFVQAYVLTIGSQNVYHYLMRKRQNP